MSSTSPVWITPAGTLGTIPQGSFYSVSVVAIPPDNSTPVYYKVISGSLPSGFVCGLNGVLSGIPQLTSTVSYSEAFDVTSKFTIRAYTIVYIDGIETISSLSDRSFSFTVTGDYVPQFITPAGSLGDFDVGDYILDLQVNFFNPAGTIEASIYTGNLPNGLTMTTTGEITGVIDDPSGTFDFTVKLTNGIGVSLRDFSITTNPVAYTIPVITTPQGSIGTVRSNIVYSFQFMGINADNRPFTFDATTALPPGLTLDPNTGWLYGTLASAQAVDNTYTFSMRARQVANPSIQSPVYTFTLEVLGTLSNALTWLDGPDLGTISNGATSTLWVGAVSNGGQTLTYELAEGYVNSLPTGLSLVPDGDIIGRVSFDTFSLDQGYTFFDGGTTTFDMTHTFTVHVFSNDGTVSAFRTFTITVVREFNEPYNNLYIQAMPGLKSREIIYSLISSSAIFPQEYVYRLSDPNFGVSPAVLYWHCFGLFPADRDNYLAALSENHFWRNITLGEVKTARAVDANGVVIYEAVYSEVIDNIAADNQSVYESYPLLADTTEITADTVVYNVDSYTAVSVTKTVALPYSVTNYSDEVVSVVYPNSLGNMRDRVIDTVGQVSNILPLWMTSPQNDGTVLGFTPAWVIAYAKPGYGGQFVYNINQQLQTPLNQIDFEIDRYELDNYLTHGYINFGTPVEDLTLTTFDISNHYQLADLWYPDAGGTGYHIGDIIRIPGSTFGWADTINDVIITVLDVSSTGSITVARCVGDAPLGSSGQSFNNVSGTNIVGSGTGALWNLIISDDADTTYDNSELNFVEGTGLTGPYTDIDWNKYNKFLVFQNRTILGNPPIS